MVRKFTNEAQSKTKLTKLNNCTESTIFVFISLSVYEKIVVLNRADDIIDDVEKVAVDGLQVFHFRFSDDESGSNLFLISLLLSSSFYLRCLPAMPLNRTLARS